MKKLVLFISLQICLCNFLLAHNLVSGIVTDSLDRPVSGVKVSYSIEDKVVYTNGEGWFELWVEVPKGYLTFEHMGYAKRSIPLAGNLKELHVIMQPSINEIDFVEVFSTGYQVVAKERATGSFEHLGSEILEQRISSNILDKLEGYVPGLQYDNRKGKAEINIRGINTLSDGLRGPLIVVDNFPYEGAIEDINPNDVESVTFLKDAAASSIWGSRAGNGVIVINLKKPSDKLQVGVVSNYTLREKIRIKEMPYLNPSDFIDVEKMLFKEGFYNSAYNSANARLNIFSPVVDMLFKQQNGLLSQEEVEKKIADFRETDFRDELLKYIYQNESLQQYNLSISNGTAHSKYRMSMGYNRAGGQMLGSSTDNLSLNLQHILKPNDKIEISTRLGLINTQGKSYHNLIDHNYSPGGGKSNLYPYAALRDDMGNNLTIPAHYNANFIDTVGQGRLLDWHYVPLDDVGHNLANNSSQQIEAQLNVEYSPLSWLKVTALYNYQTYRNEAEALNKQSSFYTRSLINQFTQIDGDNINYIVPLGGINNRSHGLMNSHKVRGSLAINHDFNGSRHNVAAIIGSELSTMVDSQEGNVVYGYDPGMMTAQVVDMLNLHPIYDGLAANRRIPGGQSRIENTRRYVSLFANGAYTYNNKYTLSLSARKDGSNLFGVATNDRWNPLWSTGLAWSIHRESFLKDKTWISNLRLRATYGHSGNSGGMSTSLPKISYSEPTSTNVTPLPRAMVSDLPNMNLKWEDVRMINTGIDFSVFNHLLSGSVEYFDKKATDLLATDRLDPTVGFSSVRRNVGVLEGKGWDMSLFARKHFGKFGFSSSVFLSKTKDLVKEYQGTNARANVYVANAGRNFQIAEGKQLYPVFALPFEGLDPENGNPLGRLDGEVSTNYLQMNRDSLHNVTYYGTGLPPYHGSFRQTISWERLELSFLISFKFGHYFQKPTILYGDLFNAWGGHKDFEKRWQNPGDELHTTVPSLIYPANSTRDSFYAYSEANIEKGDLIRLQDINMTYRLEPKVGGKKVNLTIYAAVNNVGLLWTANKAGIDPDYNNMSPSRRFSLGLNCNF